MNIVTMIAILCTVAAFASVICCTVSILIWARLCHVDTTCREDNALIRAMAARMGSADSVFKVEIEQPQDDPVPVVAMQSKQGQSRTPDQ